VKFWTVKFGSKIIVPLLVTAAAPLVFTLFMIDRLVEESMAVGLNEQVLSSLRSGVELYKEVIKSRMRIVRMQGNHLASDEAFVKASREKDLVQLQTLLEDLVDGSGWISQAVVRDSQEIIAQVKSPVVYTKNKWRPKTDRWSVVDEVVLELTFVISRDFLLASHSLRELVVIMESLRRDFQPWKKGYYRLFVFVYIWILVSAVILGVLLARSVTRRVAKLVEATRQASDGDLAVRVELTSGDEIGLLAASFNKMMDDIQRGRDRIVYLEKISSWQEIARRMAPEIKNPLTPIQLAVQELHRSYRGADSLFEAKLDDSLEIVEEEVGTLKRMVETFSEFAKMPSVQTQKEDLGVFVSDFLKLHPQFVDSVVLKKQASVSVCLDRVLMGRVLSNILVNALEASQGCEPVELNVLADGIWGQVSIRDYGSGLTEEALQHLFAPYFTTKAQGTGLGLAIVKKIVLQHGGEISVGNAPGGGAEFYIRLPRVK
jgi:nitrogen fixation/metabolism regulation signal transduction histidine kinase